MLFQCFPEGLAIACLERLDGACKRLLVFGDGADRPRCFRELDEMLVLHVRLLSQP